MSRAARLVPGQARTCPLCKATILESASVCPGCRHHLRFDSRAGPLEWESVVPLRVAGTIHRPADADAWEYSIVLAIRDERGQELTRQVLGVGAIRPTEERTFELSVEVLTPMQAGVEAQG